MEREGNCVRGVEYGDVVWTVSGVGEPLEVRR